MRNWRRTARGRPIPSTPALLPMTNVTGTAIPWITATPQDIFFQSDQTPTQDDGFDGSQWILTSVVQAPLAATGRGYGINEIIITWPPIVFPPDEIVRVQYAGPPPTVLNAAATHFLPALDLEVSMF